MRRFAAAALTLAFGFGWLATNANADERLAGIACRSVHLQFPAPQGTVFANEVTVERSAPGTYFCVCGFNHGYFGLQELADGKKLIIFSVWDPGKQDDPTAVKEESRVKLVYKDDAVRVGRFGNEGTGGQSFLDFDWREGVPYRFMVKSEVEGNRTLFTAYFLPPEAKAWRKLVTFSTITGGDSLAGYYSFVEDFQRNKVSATKTRRARFGDGWVRGKDARWVALNRAKFTADKNPALNIDAGLDAGRFFLATGGEIANEHVKLGESVDLAPAGLPEAP